jgi:Spy/CpxP family protein refolding chaperone
MRFGRFLLALAGGLLLVTPALSQPGGGRGFGGFGGGFGGGGLANMIGQSKQLQDELKMNEDQVTKLRDALTKVREDTREDAGKLFSPDTSAEDRAAIQKKVREANEKAVASVLKAEQLKRLHQIENQQAGVGMFSREDIQKTLKLSDEQKDKIKEINTELRKGLDELNPGRGGAGGGGGRGGRGGFGGFGGFDPEAQKKRQDLQKDALKAVVKVLDTDQKTAYKDLTGEPFELRFEGFAGGGGGFGGFGGFGQPGKILSPGTQDQLRMTGDQKKKLEELQKEIDERLAKILTEEQNKQLKDMQQGGGRGGFGGGRGGRGGPGGGGKPQGPDF